MAGVRPLASYRASDVQRVADTDLPELPPTIDRDLLAPPPVSMRDLPNLQRLQGLRPPLSSAPADDGSYERARKRLDVERQRQLLEQQRLQWLRSQQR